MDNNTTIGQSFKAIQRFHLIFCGTLAAILIAIRYIVKNNGGTPDNNLIFEISGIFIGFIGVISARILFFLKTKSALVLQSIREKLAIFKEAFILQLALLQGAALTNIILYFITKNDLFFFISLGILLLMAFRRPTRAIAAMVLFNSMEDKQVIYSDSTPI